MKTARKANIFLRTIEHRLADTYLLQLKIIQPYISTDKISLNRSKRSYSFLRLQSASQINYLIGLTNRQ